ncbi:ATP-binding cassette sub-family A member 3 [Araneus ventricosus]|uniref:ATP-binding cassette sub-family A member 3 n=1 Tax=Araneus ventricosus TaxID=182803 RepID=A0A4Y2Q3P0_ARAVE|nr:ATP-binding cassette sub-family A member 3 [Araneus ventricosus]
MKMAETNGLRQFLILLYKGFLLRKRHYIITFFEIVIPILIATIPCMILSETSTKYDEENYHSSENLADKFLWVNYSTYLPFDPFYAKPYQSSLEFVYAPNNGITEQFMNDSVEMFQRNTHYKDKISIRGMKTEKEMESYCVYELQKTHGTQLMIGTVFKDFGDKLPASLNYKIRYGSGMYGPSFYTSLKYQVNGPHTSNDYSYSAFLAWQASVEETFIQKKAIEQGKNVNYKVWMQQFPFPEHRNTKGSFSVVNIIPWVLCYGYLIFIINIVRRVIEEKSNGSKELLKMMGMTDFTYWASTFMNYFIIGFVTIFIITIVYKVPLKHSIVFLRCIDFLVLLIILSLYMASLDLLVLLIILSLYMASLILFCMLFSIFFNRTVFAVIALLLVYILSFTLLMIKLFMWDSELIYFPLSVLSKLCICLLPSGALLSSFYIISFYESSGEGVQWYNITEFSLVPDLNILMILGAMLFSCALYVFAIWYFDAVWPWQPGVPKPFYFFLTRSYWCGSKPSEGEEMKLVKNENSSEFFEEEPSGVSPGVVIRNLFKEFRTGLKTKLAVNDLSLNIYQGQITALLGHNGAGKTTTINILTGLYTPSSGTASINGLDILTETTRARRGLGVCPQHNVLYDTLTVEEHLRIYAASFCHIFLHRLLESLFRNQRSNCSKFLRKRCGFSLALKDQVSYTRLYCVLQKRRRD